MRAQRAETPRPRSLRTPPSVSRAIARVPARDRFGRDVVSSYTLVLLLLHLIMVNSDHLMLHLIRRGRSPSYVSIDLHMTTTRGSTFRSIFGRSSLISSDPCAKSGPIRCKSTEIGRNVSYDTLLDEASATSILSMLIDSSRVC